MICKFSIVVPTKKGRGKELSTSCRFKSLGVIHKNPDVITKMIEQCLKQAQEEQCIVEVKEVLDKEG